jgi:hypothetical protein
MERNKNKNEFTLWPRLDSSEQPARNFIWTWQNAGADHPPLGIVYTSTCDCGLSVSWNYKNDLVALYDPSIAWQNDRGRPRYNETTGNTVMHWFIEQSPYHLVSKSFPAHFWARTILPSWVYILFWAHILSCSYSRFIPTSYRLPTTCLHSFTQHDQHILCPPPDKPLLIQHLPGRCRLHRDHLLDVH